MLSVSTDDQSDAENGLLCSQRQPPSNFDRPGRAAYKMPLALTPFWSHTFGSLIALQRTVLTCIKTSVFIFPLHLNGQAERRSLLTNLPFFFFLTSESRPGSSSMPFCRCRSKSQTLREGLKPKDGPGMRQSKREPPSTEAIPLSSRN